MSFPGAPEFLEEYISVSFPGAPEFLEDYISVSFPGAPEFLEGYISVSKMLDKRAYGELIADLQFCQ